LLVHCVPGGYRLRDSVRRVSHYGDGYYPHLPGSDSPRHENSENSDNQRSEHENNDRDRNSEQNDQDPDRAPIHQQPDFSAIKPFNNDDLKIYPENGEESPNREFERDSSGQQTRHGPY